MIPDTSRQDRRIEPPKGWASRQRWLVVGGVALVAIVGWQLATRLAFDRSISQSRLTLGKAEQGSVSQDIAAEGKVVAANSPTLYAQSAGLVQLKVQAGDTVAQGQVLAEVQSPDLLSRLKQEQAQRDALRTEVGRAQLDARQQAAQLQAQLDNARIEASTAQNVLSRQRQALAAGAAARIAVEQAQEAHDKAQVSLRQAETGLKLKQEAGQFEVHSKELALQRQESVVAELQRQAGELLVRAPMAGQIGQLLVEDHAQVAANAKLMTLIDLRALEAQIQVPESLAKELATGTGAELQVDGKTVKGTVRIISPEVVGGEVATRIAFQGTQPEGLRQNQRVSARIQLSQKAGVLRLPRGSYLDQGSQPQVYVLKDQVAERRQIRIGLKGLSHVEVLGGLQAGDVVVLQGAEAFHDQPAGRVAP